MLALEKEFNDLKEVTRDGFGRVLEGMRGGRRHTIRLLTGSKRQSLSPTDVTRLRSPAHPAVAAAEVGPVEGGLYVAAEIHGHPLAQLARDAGGGPILLPPACAVVARILLDAVEAVADAGACVGPITWNNVYIDPSRPERVQVFPLWMARATSADWLCHEAKDLLFIDRDVLRQAKDDRSDLFGIGPLLLVLSCGASSLPAVDDPEDLIRAAVLGRHPLREPSCAKGPFAGAIGVTLGRAARADQIRGALGATLQSLKPLAEAVDLCARAQQLKAQAVLHRAARDAKADGLPVWPLLLFKARLEQTQGLGARAAATLLDAAAAEPRSGEVLRHLGRAAADPAEASRVLRRAVALDPLEPALRLGFAWARSRLGDVESVLRELQVVHALLIAEPQAGMQIDVARGFLALVDAASALAIAERLSAASWDVETRAEALDLAGQILYGAREYHAAARRLVGAARRWLRLGRTPLVERLNEGAFALSACRKHAAARCLALRSLEIDPDQPRLAKFLDAIPPGGKR